MIAINMQYAVLFYCYENIDKIIKENPIPEKNA